MPVLPPRFRPLPSANARPPPLPPVPTMTRFTIIDSVNNRMTPTTITNAGCITGTPRKPTYGLMPSGSTLSWTPPSSPSPSLTASCTPPWGFKPYSPLVVRLNPLVCSCHACAPPCAMPFPGVMQSRAACHPLSSPLSSMSSLCSVLMHAA